MWHAAIVLMALLTVGHADVDQQTPARPAKPLDPAVKRDGWWIRLKPDPKADAIVWQLSGADPAKTKPATLTWTRGNDPDNFDLPESVRLLDAVTLRMTAQPAGAAVSFCLFYAANGVKFVELREPTTLAVKSSERDKSCLP